MGWLDVVLAQLLPRDGGFGQEVLLCLLHPRAPWFWPLLINQSCVSLSQEILVMFLFKLARTGIFCLLP